MPALRTLAFALPLALPLTLWTPASSAPSGVMAIAPVESLVGPPWISIEHPVNPYDASTRGAFLLVHAFHHGTPTAFPVSGTAEGLVSGERRTVPLTFTRTERTGAYALTRQWPEDGTWTLLIAVAQGESDKAVAVVELGPRGEVASVRVPTRRQGSWTVPAPVALADVEAGLRVRAARMSAGRDQ